MRKRVGSNPTTPKVKITKEKRQRAKYVEGGELRVAEKMVRTLTGKTGAEEKRK